MPSTTSTERNLLLYNRILLFVAGLGGLLYGIDVGIIGGALPYLEATSAPDPGAALDHRGGGAAGQRVLHAVRRAIGGLDGTQAADDRQRHRVRAEHSGDRVVGQLRVAVLRAPAAGCSAGLVGIVVPLYLAECLPATRRGSGTAVFQWLLTLGIFVAAPVSASITATTWRRSSAPIRRSWSR